MADTQTYGHTDIQRYLQQKMSGQEMHEFEKALMNDPFLADALEGFSAGDPTLAQEHIAAIEKSLANDKHEAKVVPLAVQKTAWWKVAAVILMIISAGAITYSVINDRNTSNNDVIAVKVPKTVTLKDSIGPADKPVAQIEVLPQNILQEKNSSPVIRPEKNEAIIAQKSKRMIKEASDIRDTVKENNSLLAALAPFTKNQNEAFSAKRSMVTNAMPQNEFKGKVTDRSGEPLPYANIKANNIGVSAVADANGNFALKAPDSVLEVNVNSPGYVSTITKIISKKPQNEIALNEEELSLAEIVVTKLAKKEKRSAVNVRIDSSIAAEPAGGWKNFKQYINQQLDSLKANDADQDFNDAIALEFLIDKQGRPTDIKAPAEIDKMLADKAIKILTNGPMWKNTKKDKKVKIIIAF